MAIRGEFRRHGENGDRAAAGRFHRRSDPQMLDSWNTWNSPPVDLVAIIIQVEELVNRAIPDVNIQSFKTFGDIVRSVDAGMAES